MWTPGRDGRARIALRDRNEEVTLLIGNQENEGILLPIFRRIEDQRRMLSNSHESEMTTPTTSRCSSPSPPTPRSP